MTCDVTLVTNVASGRYDFGSDHPMRSVRARLAIDLADSLGVLSRRRWHRFEAESAGFEDLALVHDSTYIGVVGAADRSSPSILAGAGLGTQDTPVFDGLHQAAAGVVGSTLAACNLVWVGDAAHAVNLAGGLHHAMPSHASGFCVYNDAAVGISRLLQSGASRIAYLDLDAHHGDGVEAIFASDPRVLTVSIHQDGRTIFPGTGFSTDVGHVGAEGSAVNLPLPMGTGDAGWLRALTAVVPVLLREFRPEIVVTQCGCDAHRDDPLSDLRVTVEGFAAAYEVVHELAHEICGGRWVVLGGGGYDVASAVPRAWTELLAVVSGAALAGDVILPESWRQATGALTGRQPPLLLGDGADRLGWQRWDAGEGDPDDLVDRAVAATRRAVLPLHGLDPFVDR